MYVDSSMPMNCLPPACSQIFGTFLQWVVSCTSGSEVIPNYSALLLLLCLPNNSLYQGLLMTLRDVAKDLGVPLKRGSK